MLFGTNKKLEDLEKRVTALEDALTKPEPRGVKKRHMTPAHIDKLVELVAIDGMTCVKASKHLPFHGSCLAANLRKLKDSGEYTSRVEKVIKLKQNTQ